MYPTDIDDVKVFLIFIITGNLLVKGEWCIVLRFKICLFCTFWQLLLYKKKSVVWTWFDRLMNEFGICIDYLALF